MSFTGNIHRHLFAALSVEGYSHELAKDFWYKSEDLWDPSITVERRWLKLVFVYVISAIAQILLPSFLILVVLGLFANWNNFLIALYMAISITSIVSFSFAVLFASLAYRTIRRQQK